MTSRFNRRRAIVGGTLASLLAACGDEEERAQLYFDDASTDRVYASAPCDGDDVAGTISFDVRRA